MGTVIDIKTKELLKSKAEEPVFCQGCAYKRELTRILCLMMSILKEFPQELDYEKSSRKFEP